MAGKIRIGVVGAKVKGTWSARAHLPALQSHPDFELTAVCTTKPDTAEAARAHFGARLAFDDYRKMAASPEIDAVAVVVRVPLHADPVKAALEAGKHAYCEWPLARNTDEAIELTKLAKSKGVVGVRAAGDRFLGILSLEANASNWPKADVPKTRSMSAFTE